MAEASSTLNSKDNSSAPSPTKVEEISLDDLDKILESSDPEFSSGLSEIRDVTLEGEVTIESSLSVDEQELSTDEEGSRPKWLHRFPRFAATLEKISKSYGPKIQHFRSWIFSHWLKSKAMVAFWKSSLIDWLRAMPKVILGATLKVVGAIRGGVQGLVTAFRELPGWTKVGLLVFLVALTGTTSVFVMNLKGEWLPLRGKQHLKDMSQVATRVVEYDPKRGMIEFLTAFPQEEFTFQFTKMVVNLNPTPGHPNPMGYFQFNVTFDSQQAAVEAQAREKELSDLMQRKLEEIPYDEISGKIGRGRVKDVLRQSLNQVLNNGWVVDVFIKDMILKP